MVVSCRLFGRAGRPLAQTSYPGANLTGTAVNAITESYNGFGQLTSLVENVNNAGSVSGTVSYAYTETARGTENDSRLTSITYPGGWSSG